MKIKDNRIDSQDELNIFNFNISMDTIQNLITTQCNVNVVSPDSTIVDNQVVDCVSVQAGESQCSTIQCTINNCTTTNCTTVECTTVQCTDIKYTGAHCDNTAGYACLDCTTVDCSYDYSNDCTYSNDCKDD